ncbi:hypothetical protein MKZ38_003654 [Zalerion maritima]|uniref:Uncharacterized protein n=1 Tax=Zalerion maritima TaxID=339359 RepID=A0AAD5WQ37_9PEZI|nr:hypothetical protein MKZ38_003654 [Zalerion maritima]
MIIWLFDYCVEMKLPMSSQTYRDIAQAWGFPPLVLCGFRQPYWMCTLFEPRFPRSSFRRASPSSSPTPQCVATANHEALGSSETLVNQPQHPTDDRKPSKLSRLRYRGLGLLIRFDSHWERECAIALTYNPLKRQTNILLAGLGADEVNSVHHSLAKHIRDSAHLISHPMLIPTLLLSELVQNQTDWLNLITPEINSIQDVLGVGNWKYADDEGGWDDASVPAWIRALRTGLGSLRRLSWRVRFTGSGADSGGVVQISSSETTTRTVENNKTDSEQGNEKNGSSGRGNCNKITVAGHEVVENDSLETPQDVSSEDEEPRRVGLMDIIKRLNMMADSVRFQAQIASTLVRTLEEMENWLNGDNQASSRKHEEKGEEEEEDDDEVHFAKLEIRETIILLLKSLHGCQQRIEYRRGAVDGLINTVYTLIAQRDSNNMRIIAAITLLFLPGTFTAALFSTPFFDFSAPNDSGNTTSTSGCYTTGSTKINLVSHDSDTDTDTSTDAISSSAGSTSFLSPHHWVYWISTMIVTALTLAGYWLYTRRNGRDSIIKHPAAGKRLGKTPVYNTTDAPLEVRRKSPYCGW